MKLTSILGLFAVLSLILFTATAHAQTTKTFTEDFDNPQIDSNFSGAKIINGKAYVAENIFSSRIESSNFSGVFGRDIDQARIASADDSKPSGSNIIYYLSNDGGKTWAQAGYGSWIKFSKQGKSLRWAAVLARSSAVSEPYIDSITIEYQSGGEATKLANDGRRISDLRSVFDAVKSFKNDNGFYPNVSGSTAEERWRQLGELLTKSNRSGFTYIFSMPQPASSVSGPKLEYDYKYFGDGYIVFSNLESAGNWEFEFDSDIVTSGVDCRDPVYCLVEGNIQSKPVEEGSVSKNPTNYRLIRAVGDTKVYYITKGGHKRHVPNPEIFLSYGNKWMDVVTVDPGVLQNYPDNKLIYLEGDTERKAFYLGYKSKSVLSKEAVTRMGLNLNNAAPVNRIEFNYYAIDTPIL